MWAVGGKKILYPTKPADTDVKTVEIPALNDIDTMEDDFVTFKGAKHLTASVILASAALATMTLY